MNPNSRGYYPPRYRLLNPNPYTNQNAPVLDYSSGQYYYPQPQPWVAPNPNGGWQSQGYQQPHGTPGHELKRCVGPVNGFGVIDGCPMCNTKGHVLFECVQAWKSEALSADTRPKIWTPSFALQYQLENPHYWRDYVYAGTWKEDPPIAEDPAWGNPSLVNHLKDRSERELTRNASGFGRRPQSQLPPPSAQYFPPPMMPQFPSFPPPPPPPPPRSASASSPDTFTVTGAENFTKFAQNLMNLAPAGGNNGRDRKKFAIKAASNAKVKDRSQSPKAQAETETYRERSPLRTSGVKLADRMSYSGIKSSWVKADDDGDFSDNDVEPLLKVEDVLSNFDDATGDASSAAKAARKTILNRKNRARAKARRHAAKPKEDADAADADAVTAAEQANVNQDTEAEAVREVSLSARRM
ncbi:hypothetical protein BPAE_0154g00270 [Botrytis paeoniae]|uniref:Uncharacterized protein n=1 Tax=Botrytis paeoniae TaxID=278948 RepID=A0A4Z1FDZ5_9HELO|nr:hypothetical protein BPAE_0154g00270 [Botrytis paeoniae]